MRIRIHTGTGISEIKNVLKHTILDYKAGTYHELTFAKGIVLQINDFGIKSICEIPDGTSDYDIPPIA